MVGVLKTYVIDIPGAVSAGVSLGARALVDDAKCLEEEAIDLLYDDGDGFGVIVDIPRLVDASAGTYARVALIIFEEDDAEGILLIAEKAGRRDIMM